MSTYVSQGKLKKVEHNGESDFLLTDLEEYSKGRGKHKTVKEKPEQAIGQHEKSVDLAAEAQLLTDLITHAFTLIPEINGGRMTEVPRTWKIDVTTTRGPESYRVTRNPDGSFQHERW